MAPLIAVVLILFLLVAVGALLVWAISAVCQFMAALLASPADSDTP
ncbi:hypothetical protein [Stenotrophomonas maltophilia]|nr:hypothetical protein [Stenotrophomonas maltophilia]MCU1064320.1 hypothetical protein [Stenotrophomonas maltophilia]